MDGISPSRSTIAKVKAVYDEVVNKEIIRLGGGHVRALMESAAKRRQEGLPDISLTQALDMVRGELCVSDA
jgi:hypothetical protein